MTVIIPPDSKFRIGDRIKFLGNYWGEAIKGFTGTITGTLEGTSNDPERPASHSGWSIRLDKERNRPSVQGGGTNSFLPFSMEHDAIRIGRDDSNEAFVVYTKLRKDDP